VSIEQQGIAFLGGGRITAALIGGLRKSGANLRIVVHDRHPDKLARLEREFGVSVERDLHGALRGFQFWIIAVRPRSVPDLLSAIRAELPSVSGSIVAVSVAAGVSLTELRKSLGPPVRWARAMPSPATSTLNGLTALAFDQKFPPFAKKDVRELFSRLGNIVEIEDSQFDVFTATFSVSHGYHAMSALVRAAQNAGLDSKTAELAAAHAIGDAINSWRVHERSLRELLLEAATPGGIAAAVIASLEKDGYTDAIERAVRAGIAQAKTAAKREEGGAK
jgi:pyrroline-5-carboxylate reductase